jgi:hypothetical protein
MFGLPSLRGAFATKQSILFRGSWIASRSLSSGARSRDPVARNDDAGNARLVAVRDSVCLARKTEIKLKSN